MVEIEKFEKSIKTFCQNLVIKMKLFFFVWFSFEDLVETIILHPSLLVVGIWKVD